MEYRETTDSALRVSEIGFGTYAMAGVYAIEGLAELDLAAEQELITHIRQVVKMMKGGACDVSSLEAIRKDLSRYVSSSH